ncbi:RNA polymerase sigma factor [Roseibium sp.]|uniref:RNA polymerase sigma factor n=1 Tax=Roseibium sp. TaxID=1936156 RepID=UPI003D0D4989
MAASKRDIETHIPALRRFAYGLTGDRDEGDDLVQDALERALSRWHLFIPGRKLRPWLFKILYNLFVSARRKDSRRAQHVPLEPEKGMPAIAAGQEHAADAGKMLRLLDTLPEDQRSTVLLVVVEGFSYEETARISGVPMGTVMSRLHRGRQQLRTLAGESPPAIRRVK